MQSSDAENLVQTIAPEIAAPVYVLMAGDGLPESFRMAKTIAYTARHLDLSLREEIGDCWQGRGHAVIIDDLMIADCLAEQIATDDELTPLLMQQRLAATLAHEVAHIIDRQFDASEPTPATVEYAGAFRKFVLASCAAGSPLIGHSTPWLGHDGGWLRAVLHLLHRLEGTLLRVPPNLAIQTGFYWLSSVWRYKAALESELQAWGDRSLFELKNVRPPEDFVSLWLSDLRDWFFESKKTPEVNREYLMGLALFEGEVCTD